jgi:hypothetical protein
MSKKLLGALTCVALAVGVLLLNRPRQITQASAPSPPQTRPGTIEAPRRSHPPEHVIYRFFFHHLMALKDRAAEVERKGGDGKALRAYYKNKAKLSDSQANNLDQIAADCDREVARLDARAKALINAFRVRASAAHSANGKPLPELPPELKALQQQRDQTILGARQKLRTAMGIEAFRQLDDFIKVDVERNANPAKLQPAISQ